MGYVADRDLEQLARLDAEISNFIYRYKQHSPSGPRKTIILFPGGMGSSLKWASTPYGATPYSYDTVWLDCSITAGAGHLLKMNGEEDDDGHFVIADGCVSFSIPFNDLKPYDGFLRWCEDNEFDWFAFGWDWRRRPEAVAAFFLNRFVPKFRQRVQAECGVDPFDDVTLLGHSFGGMLIKLILNHGGAVIDQIERAITVGTPFYGHAGHLHRYFKGEPLLDGIWDYDKRNLTQLISSMRGPYTLLYLDEATYQRDKAALAQDTAFPMLRYPLKDDATGAVADPYNPGTLGNKVRYPRDWGFVGAELNSARNTYQQVARPLSPVTNVKFHNIRAVQRHNGANAFATVHEQRWKWIDRDFDPLADETPIVDKTMCPGDGVIPAWSARLVSTPPDNVHTLFGEIDDDFEHMELMSCESVQEQIFTIMQQTARRSAPMVTRKRIAPKPELASREELDAFLAEVKAAQALLPPGDERRHSAIFASAAKRDRAELGRLMRRAFVDLPKSLSQKLGKPPTERSGEPLDDPYAKEKPKSKPAAPRVQRKPKDKPK
jgi:pimeloyl-ACP methyl ester carboxylesterase